MLKQLHVEKYFPLFHAIICQFLVNDTGGVGLKKKMTKCDMEGGRLKICNFASDVLFE